jgi:hypothetical protein
MVERPRPITVRPRTQASSERAYNAAEVGMGYGEGASPGSAKGTSALGETKPSKVAQVYASLPSHPRRSRSRLERPLYVYFVEKVGN